MHGYFKISTYCSSLTLAPVQKTFASASCHLSSAGHCDQNSGNRRAQVSQDHPSGLTPVTQAEHEQQNSLPLACSQPAASCNIPPLGNQTGSITHSITTVTCSKYIIEYLICFISLFPDQVHTSTVFNCRLTTSTPVLSPQRPGSVHNEPVRLLNYNPPCKQ